MSKRKEFSPLEERPFDQDPQSQADEVVYNAERSFLKRLIALKRRFSEGTRPFSIVDQSIQDELNRLNPRGVHKEQHE